MSGARQAPLGSATHGLHTRTTGTQSVKPDSCNSCITRRKGVRHNNSTAASQGGRHSHHASEVACFGLVWQCAIVCFNDAAFELLSGSRESGLSIRIRTMKVQQEGLALALIPKMFERLTRCCGWNACGLGTAFTLRHKCRHAESGVELKEYKDAKV